MDSPHPSFTVLRIKRKATEAPLSSLVIQDDPDTRIKKRRDVSARARGIFRLAETVPETWQGEGDEAAFLRDRIRRLLAAEKEEDQDTKEPQHTSSSPESDVPTVPPAPPPPQYQYRVIPPTSPRTRAMLPPRVLTIAETERPPNPLVFVDAQAVEAGGNIAGPSKLPAIAGTTNGDRHGRRPLSEDEGGDGEMAAFQSMLQEYLDFERSTPPKKNISPALPSSAPRSGNPASETERYVYDLYFRDLRPSLSSTPLALGVGDGVSIGALLGYEDLSPSSSPDASEPEDEADEDSNDEDYYRNDYPEDEDADEDMRGYRDAFSDEEAEGEEEDERERGEWDYR